MAALGNAGTGAGSLEQIVSRSLIEAPSFPGFAVPRLFIDRFEQEVKMHESCGDGHEESRQKLLKVLLWLTNLGQFQRRYCVAFRMAGILPLIVDSARSKSVARSVSNAAMQLLAVCCEDPVCCEEVGWLGGHHLFLREILSGSESAEAAVTACTSCASLVEFPTATKPGLSVDKDDRRPALTFSFNGPSTGTLENVDSKTRRWNIVLQEIPTTPADIAASERTNMTVGYHHWDAGTALAIWVARHADAFESSVVLEIGSGLGLPGIVAAAVARTASCTLSDFNPKIVANLEKNVDINAVYFSNHGNDHSKPNCTRLDWDNLASLHSSEEEEEDDDERSTSKQLPQPGSVDVILGSDIICQDSDCIGICRTIVHFLKPQTGKAVFICGGTKNRYGIDKFPAACQENGLVLESSPVGEDILSEMSQNQTHNSRPHDDLTLFQVRL